MKNISIILITACLVLTACGEDRRKEYVERTAYAHWMEDTMRDYYYWYDGMPDSNGLNYFNKPDVFLKALRASNDKSYSYVENPNEEANRTSYGIHFESSVKYTKNYYALRVLYVESDSPAEDAGIKRGDWIIKRNSEFITSVLLDSLSQGKSIELTRGIYVSVTPTPENNTTTTFSFDELDTVTLDASRITTNSPFLYSAIYSEVGYLVYNRFASGTSDDDKSYNDRLKTLSNEFKAAGITDLILDLRYNTGGEFEVAQLLGTILVPETALNQPMCKLEYNDKHTDNNKTILFESELIGSGSNLNLSKLYVITGSKTSSTADVLINCLKPYMNVILIGTTSVGNYSATHKYIHEDDPYILHLVDCMIGDKDGIIASAGHIPTYALNELAPITIAPFGENEYLVSSTLYLIENGTMPPVSARSQNINELRTFDAMKPRATAMR